MRSMLAAKQIWVVVITIWGTLDSLPRCPNIKIFHIYAGMQQILLNFVFMYKNFNFSYSWVLKNYMQKWSVFMQIWWKDSDWNFVQKIIFILNEFAISCKTCLVLIWKWCRILFKKSHFVQNHATLPKRIDCFVETLIRRLP